MVFSDTSLSLTDGRVIIDGKAIKQECAAYETRDPEVRIAVWNCNGALTTQPERLEEEVIDEHDIILLTDKPKP